MSGFDPVRDRALDAIIRLYRAGSLGGGGVSDGDYGDVVVTAGGTVWTLDAAVSAAFAPVSHVGSGGAAHANVVASGASGFMTGADKAKLDAITGTNTGDQTTITGNAGSATVLATPRNISITGKVTAAGGNFDGSAALALNVTAVTLVAGDIPNIAQSQVTNLVSDLAAKQPLDAQLTDLAALGYAGNALKVVRVNAGETAFELATGGAGGGTTITSGTATVDFGAFPGSTDASVAVTGQTGILAGSKVKAWVMATATADHTADEHLVDPPRVDVGPVTAGVGFTIYAFTNNTRRHYGAYTVAWEWS